MFSKRVSLREKGVDLNFNGFTFLSKVNVSLREKGVDLNALMVESSPFTVVSLREKGVDLNIINNDDTRAGCSRLPS